MRWETVFKAMHIFAEYGNHFLSNESFWVMNPIVDLM